MEKLILDLLVDILLYLESDPKDLLTCCRVCKRWKDVIEIPELDRHFWRPAAFRRWSSKLCACSGMPDGLLLAKKSCPCTEYPDGIFLARKTWKEAYLIRGKKAERKAIRYGWTVYIDASKVGLTVIPRTTFVNASSLRQLSFRYNEISILPLQFSLLTNLVILALDYNCIEELPDHLSTMSQLQDFSISYNRLPCIPSTYSCLTSLCTLNLQHNRLVHVGSPIVQLTCLFKLDLRDNAIASYDAALFDLTKLTYLDMTGNSLMFGIPKDVTKLKNLKPFPDHPAENYY